MQCVGLTFAVDCGQVVRAATSLPGTDRSTTSASTPTSARPRITATCAARPAGCQAFTWNDLDYCILKHNATAAVETSCRGVNGQPTVQSCFTGTVVGGLGGCQSSILITRAVSEGDATTRMHPITNPITKLEGGFIVRSSLKSSALKRLLQLWRVCTDSLHVVAGSAELSARCRTASCHA